MIVFLIYVTGAIACLVPFTRAIVRYMLGTLGEPSDVDMMGKGLAVTLAMMLSALWPAVIVGWFVYSRAFPKPKKPLA